MLCNPRKIRGPGRPLDIITPEELQRIQAEIRLILTGGQSPSVPCLDSLSMVCSPSKNNNLPIIKDDYDSKDDVVEKELHPNQNQR